MLVPVLVHLFFLAAGSSGSAADLRDVIDLYERGEFGRACTLLQARQQTEPEDASIRLWLGKCYWKSRRWDEAIKELEKAVALEPSNAMCQQWLGRSYGEKARHVSRLLAFPWARKVVKQFERAAHLAPDNLSIRFDLLEYYVQAPGIVGGGRDKAEHQVREITQLSPRMGRVARARILEEDRKWESEQRELAQAASEFSNQAESFAALADFMLRRGDFGGAAENARKALMLHQDLPRAILLLAAARVRLGIDLAESAEALKKLGAGHLTDNDPPFESVFYWLGQALLAQNDKTGCRKALETALRFNPEYEPAVKAFAQVR